MRHVARTALTGLSLWLVPALPSLAQKPAPVGVPGGAQAGGKVPLDSTPPAAAPTPGGGATAAPSLDNAAISPDALAAARDVADESGMLSNMQQILSNLRGLLVQSLTSRGISATAAAGAVDEVLLPEMQRHSSELVDGAVRVYARNFTIDELRQLRDFYATPLGRRLVSATPELTREITELGQSWGRRVAAEAIQTHRDTLRQRGIPL